MSSKTTSPIHTVNPEAGPLIRRVPSGLLLRTPHKRDLWVEGDERLLRAGPRVAVIGSRTPTPDQIAVATGLTRALSDAGAIICSGGALGVDGVAHRTTLHADGITVLVSPVAPTRTYPSRHEQLFTDVRARGVVLSPFPPETAFSRSHFRVRNGVIARLVDALIVICADRRSGSLHCARQAWKLGVPVFAVPWTPRSVHAEGTNLLLHGGARAVATPEQARRIVARLRANDAASWLLRDVAPPVGEAMAHVLRKAANPGHNTAPESPALIGRNVPDDSSAIDAKRRHWQRYATVGLQPVTNKRQRDTRQLEELKALSAQDEDGAIRQALRREHEGVSLEQLVADTGRTRAELARLLLRWTLTGTARRDAWGRYHDG